MSYLRRMGGLAGYTETSIELDKEVVKAAEEAVIWAKDTGRNDLGIALAVIRSLKDNNALVVQLDRALDYESRS